MSNAFGRLFGALTSTFVAQKAQLILARALPRRVPVLPSLAHVRLIAQQNRAAGSTPSINDIVAGGAGKVNLVEEEGLGPSHDGGHTLRSGHVGRPDADLAASPKEQPSTFTDLRTANRAVTEDLRQNRRAIKEWMDGKPGPKPEAFFYRESGSVGRVRLSDGTIVDTAEVKVVLQCDGNGNLIVLTAFPVWPGTIP